MTHKPEDLIKKLALKVPQKRLFSPIVRTILFTLAALAYISVVALLIYNPRHDLAVKVSSIMFSAEEVFALVTGFLAAFIAMWSAVPGEPKTSKHKWWPLISLGVLFSFIAIGDFIYHEHIEMKEIAAGMHCSINMPVLALPPLGLFIYLVLRAAPTKPMFTGFFIVLSVTAFAYFGMRIICPNDGMEHHMSAHILPLLFFSALGFWIGKRFLRW